VANFFLARSDGGETELAVVAAPLTSVIWATSLILQSVYHCRVTNDAWDAKFLAGALNGPKHVLRMAPPTSSRTAAVLRTPISPTRAAAFAGAEPRLRPTIVLADHFSCVGR
jgi:hypothetical protein